MIKANIIADSISSYSGKRIMTFELEYHRYIHSELMTHRVFSRNAASSRAIPVAKMLEMVRNEPAVPLHFGKNRPGMQATEEVENPDMAAYLWKELANNVADGVQKLVDLGVHKQVANRPLEPYQFIKTVLTTTEHENWYWLRDHSDAQPEIQALAKNMYYWHNKSKPKKLDPGEWHMPYVTSRKIDGCQFFYDEHGRVITLQEALMISSSCCAQVSYRKLDGTLEKAEDIFKKLIESEPCHASPTEHQAMAIGQNKICNGVTHLNLRDGSPGSGNFSWWVQHRQLIPNNAKYG